MATGYTADVQSGKVTDFQTFALKCARAFGALIEMRDSDMDAPIPDSFKPDSYHAKALIDARAELVRLRAMSGTQADKQASADYREAIEEWDRAQTERALRRERYQSMLTHVRAWKPPSKDHVGLKDFMIQQLTESMEFEGDDDRWKPKLKDGATWRSDAIVRAQENVTYHEKHHGEDVKRATERTEWVQQLRDSLAREHEPQTR